MEHSDTVILFVQTNLNSDLENFETLIQSLSVYNMLCTILVSSDDTNLSQLLDAHTPEYITIELYKGKIFSMNEEVLSRISLFKYVLYMDDTFKMFNLKKAAHGAKHLINDSYKQVPKHCSKDDYKAYIPYRVFFKSPQHNMLCTLTLKNLLTDGFTHAPDTRLNDGSFNMLFNKIIEANTIFTPEYVTSEKLRQTNSIPFHTQTAHFINTYNTSSFHWNFFVPSLINVSNLTEAITTYKLKLINIPHFEYVFSMCMKSLKYNTNYIQTTHPHQNKINLTQQNKLVDSSSPPPHLNTTIVTAFIELDIVRPPKRTTATYDYMDKCADTLSIPQPMIIFVSESIIDRVIIFRENIGLSHLTRVIKVTQDDLYMINNLSEIETNVKKNRPPYNIAKYILAVNSRYNLIKRAIEYNAFNTDFFSWVDFSAGHVVNITKNNRLIYSNTERVRISVIGRVSEWTGHPHKKEVSKFSYDHKCCGGGIFIAHKLPMLELIKLHDEEFIKLMKAGFCINDDKLLYIIFTKYPYLFDTYVSGYQSIISKL